ncbi:hypothetical protein SNE40_000216 [Patella caerulea]|uniref:FAM194 C-terminal domain-containing protein n=1 Tax=Patella caerulea TaxID=87958 RepID=A0AAN8KKN7_PATCE
MEEEYISSSTPTDGTDSEMDDNGQTELKQEMKQDEETTSEDSEDDVKIPNSADLQQAEETDETSTILDRPGSKRTSPKITQNFRPELKSGDKSGRSSQRSVTFNQENSSIDSPIMEKKKTYDGREVTLVTLVTQTDWDWVDDTVKEMSAKEATQSTKTKFDIEPAELTAKGDQSTRELTSRGKSENTIASLDTLSNKSPFSMPYNDEYGIPLLDMSTSDDDSSDDDIPGMNPDDRNFLPSIGPPQILQYIRESELEDPDISPTDYQQTNLSGEVGGYADYRDFPVDENGRPVGIYGGNCEFCEHEIKPFPNVEQQQKFPPEELYCCEQYREFVQFATTTAFELEEETAKVKKKISIKPHAHFGSKKARKAAKERAVQRMRDRELQRRQQEATGLQNYYAGSPTGGPAEITAAGGSKQEVHGASHGTHVAPLVSTRGNQYRGGGPQISYKDMVARQMKTINYQLSSQKCFEEGWTVLAPSPTLDEEDMMDVFEIITKKSGKRELTQKSYDSGKKFLTIFPDGTGSVFYPSGNLAVAICKMDVGSYIYIIHDNTEQSNVLGVFEPNGYGYCYHDNGNIRLYFDQLEGVELDTDGAKRKKWSWKDQQTHVHAPPFQPICFAFNRYIGIRVMSQENIAVTFMAKNCSCRFNVGAILKLVAPENIRQKQVNDDYVFMEEKKVAIACILDKISNLLRFPHSPKINKILPPIRVTNKLQKVEELRSKQRGRRSGMNRSSLQQVQSTSNSTLPAVTVN